MSNQTLPVTDAPADTSRVQRLNQFLDQHVLPYPVKYLTNRLTIIATLCLLVPLIIFANVQVFVLATNSYLNVMSVVVSSTVLLYSTIAEVRDRKAAARREEIAKAHDEAVEQRAEADHELIMKIRDELAQHVTESLDNIQKILIDQLENIQQQDHLHIEEMHKAVLASTEAHRKELDELNSLMKGMLKG
jgi:ABC-type multidrug transport system fused ATPase/permease subunit